LTSKKADQKAGRLELQKGDGFTLRYRLLLHQGDADIIKQFDSYRQTP